MSAFAEFIQDVCGVDIVSICDRWIKLIMKSTILHGLAGIKPPFEIQECLEDCGEDARST
jgi:hypothetical protein